MKRKDLWDDVIKSSAQEQMKSNVIVNMNFSKNEPDCHATQLVLKSTNEAVVHSFIKPEKTSNKPSNDRKKYKCYDYRKSFGKVINLKSQFLTQSEQSPYKCGVCGKCFKFKCQLIAHLVTQTEQSPYKCSVCGNQFKFRGKLKTHLNIHSELRPHKCDVCGKCFKQKANLKTHLNIHKELRPHQCDVCGKCFKRKCHLIAHLCFKRKCHLIAHLVTHGEHRPHKCDVCGKCFKLNTDLTNVMFVASVSKKRAILKLISILIINADLTNLMFKAIGSYLDSRHSPNFSLQINFTQPMITMFTPRDRPNR
uniref:C2H2-type domain-containing protein n=1 Tax=Timema cristinae TaxID=61476 RepID=A0A7R9DBW1_TIMCR|nr:unnamed protein product [Timema cristinae]